MKQAFAPTATIDVSDATLRTGTSESGQEKMQVNTETEKTAKTGSVKTPERSPSGKSGSEHRIVEQPGFVLHSYVYKESSLVVDVFTRDYGRAQKDPTRG